MKRALLGVVLWMSWLGCALAEDPVYFADPNLKAVVEATLWVSDPTPTDMLGLTSLSSAPYPTGPGIADLTGLEYAKNLQTLSLPQNGIDGVSPLSGLTALETLVLNNNLISDVSALSGLSALRHLDLHDNTIIDIGVLSGMTDLQTLILRGNRISDISPLSCLSDLEELWLNDNNGIRDLSPLSQLVNLQLLVLHWNHIDDISPLSGLTHLRTLDLAHNKIFDVCPLVGLTYLREVDLRENPLGAEACGTCLPQIRQNNPGVNLQYDSCGSYHILISSTAGGSVTYPGEGEFIYDNAEIIKVQARADPCSVFVGWTGSYPSQNNPIFITMRKDHEIRANFVSVLDTIHVDDDGPNDPGPRDSAVSDSGENGTQGHPFDRVQEAVEVARKGVTIVVHAGTYRETIDLLGKSLTLTGFDPGDPNAAGWPVLDSGGAGPVVSFTHGEDPNCIVSGFVITGGKGRSAGAIFCSSSSPTIANCLIVGNEVTDVAGGAVYCVNGDAALVNCTIADNFVNQGGAGLSLLDSHVEVVNSILWGNGASEIVSAGVGGASVYYSDIAGGWEGPGCINVDPLFAGAGHWAGTIWVMGDYHLQSQGGRCDPKVHTWVLDQMTSPCIDAGDPSSPVGDEALPNGGIINPGAFGGTTEASKSSL